jgi:hypothetical protein
MDVVDLIKELLPVRDGVKRNWLSPAFMYYFERLKDGLGLVCDASFR